MVICMFQKFCEELVKQDVFQFNSCKNILKGDNEKFKKLTDAGYFSEYDQYRNHQFVNMRDTLSPHSKQPLIGNPCIGYGLVNQFRAGNHEISRYKGTYFINYDPNECHSGIENKALGIRIHERQLQFLHFKFDLCHTEECAKEGLKFVVLVEGKPSKNFCIDLCPLKKQQFKEHIAFFLLHV